MCDVLNKLTCDELKEKAVRISEEMNTLKKKQSVDFKYIRVSTIEQLECTLVTYLAMLDQKECE